MKRQRWIDEQLHFAALVQRRERRHRQQFANAQEHALAVGARQIRQEPHAAIRTAVEHLHQLPRQLPTEHFVRRRADDGQEPVRHGKPEDDDDFRCQR